MTVNRTSVLLVIAAGMLVGAGLGIIILLGLGKTAWLSSLQVPWKEDPTPRVGVAAPDFELLDLSGSPVRLSELRGKPVLLNFWATWCGPCRLEMPDLQDVYEDFEGEFLILAVNADEEERIVAKFAKDIAITFDVLMDPGGNVQSLYLLRGYPTSYLVDADGIIRVQHIGLMHESQLVEYLAKVGVTR